MRVVVGHHVADDPRALHERAVGPHVGVVHRPQDAALHRLQAVAHVGQRARHDHAHRVLEERGLHLFHQRATRRLRVARRAEGQLVRSPVRGLPTGHPGLLHVEETPTHPRTERLWRCAGSSCDALRRRRPSSTESVLSSAPVPSSKSRRTRRRVCGIHARLAQLVGIHLAEALEARELQLAVGVLLDDLEAARFVGHVHLLAADLDRVERRLRDEEPARLHQRQHLAVEERDQQCADVPPSTSASASTIILP